jgi:hypothetical protein
MTKKELLEGLKGATITIVDYKELKKEVEDYIFNTQKVWIENRIGSKVNKIEVDGNVVKYTHDKGEFTALVSELNTLKVNNSIAKVKAKEVVLGSLHIAISDIIVLGDNHFKTKNSSIEYKF